MSRQRSAQQDGITGHILGELDPNVWFSHRLEILRKPLLVASWGVTDPGDSPASQDALRDDLVANAIPDIEALVTGNKDWTIAGTNATDALVTVDVDNPGLLFSTAGAAVDTMALGVNEVSNASVLGTAEWDTSKELVFQAIIRTPATITPDMILMGGFMLTMDNITDFAAANDADGFFFRYENGVNGGKFQVVMNYGTSSTAVDSKVTVAASTQYKISLRLTPDRTLQAVINDSVVLAAGDSQTVDADVDLKPHLGVGETTGGAGDARSFTLHDLLVARKVA